MNINDLVTGACRALTSSIGVGSELCTSTLATSLELLTENAGSLVLGLIVAIGAVALAKLYIGRQQREEEDRPDLSKRDVEVQNPPPPAEVNALVDQEPTRDTAIQQFLKRNLGPTVERPATEVSSATSTEGTEPFQQVRPKRKKNDKDTKDQKKTFVWKPQIQPTFPVEIGRSSTPSSTSSQEQEITVPPPIIESHKSSTAAEPQASSALPAAPAVDIQQQINEMSLRLAAAIQERCRLNEAFLRLQREQQSQIQPPAILLPPFTHAAPSYSARPTPSADENSEGLDIVRSVVESALAEPSNPEK